MKKKNSTSIKKVNTNRNRKKNSFKNNIIKKIKKINKNKNNLNHFEIYNFFHNNFYINYHIHPHYVHV